MEYVLIILPKIPAKPSVNLAVKDKDGLDTAEIREKTPTEIALDVDYSVKKQITEEVEASALNDFPLTGRYKTILGQGLTVTDKDENEYTARWIPADRFTDRATLKEFIDDWYEKEKDTPGLVAILTGDPKAWLTKSGFSVVIPADAGIQREL